MIKIINLCGILLYRNRADALGRLCFCKHVGRNIWHQISCALIVSKDFARNGTEKKTQIMTAQEQYYINGGKNTPFIKPFAFSDWFLMPFLNVYIGSV